jgi:hypothetical protein
MRTSSEIIADIEAKSVERDVLLKSLRRSMAIDDLWPGCFELGKVTSQYTGKTYVLEKFVIKVTTPDGSVESREFDPMEVPETLWPTGFRENYPRRDMR